jgi:hypothetical protein
MAQRSRESRCRAGERWIRFPVAKSLQDLAAEGGNPRVDIGRAVLMFPLAFDPARRWLFWWSHLRVTLIARA